MEFINIDDDICNEYEKELLEEKILRFNSVQADYKKISMK